MTDPGANGVAYNGVVLTLDLDGTVRCTADGMTIGPADDYLELQPLVDAHFAAEHPELA